MSKFGRRNGKAAKLTAREVIEIRKLYASSQATQGRLSIDFGISIGQIGRIVRGEVWQDLGHIEPTKEEIELSGRRMLELTKQVHEESALERMNREVAEEKATLPDNMIDELSEIPEGDI